MTCSIVELEIEALELKVELEDLTDLIRALPGDTAAAQIKAVEATRLAGKLADRLADALEAAG